MIGSLAVRLMAGVFGLLSLACSTPSEAGGFLFTDTGRDNRIVHPPGYTGTQGELVVGVCLAAEQIPSPWTYAQAQASLAKALATWNAQIASQANLAHDNDNDIPDGAYDFESVLVHELGHCLGLEHTNLAAESNLPGAAQNGTRATPGGDGVITQGAGPDGLHGSPDDSRGDDQPLYWFERNWADPMRLPDIIDLTTYSRTLGDLPAGQTFPSNADRTYLAARGIPHTEGVMQQGQFLDEAQRRLTAEDIATLRLAQAGLDGIQGTDDDYTLRMVPATSGCGIEVGFDDSVSFAACQVTGATMAPDHMRITSARLRLSPHAQWYLSPVANTRITRLGSSESRMGMPFDVHMRLTTLAGQPPGFPSGPLTVEGSDTHRCTTTLDSQGTALCPWPARATPGPLTLRVVYPGYRGFDSTQAQFTHTVHAPTPHQLTVQFQPGEGQVGLASQVWVHSSSPSAAGRVQVSSAQGSACDLVLVEGRGQCEVIPHQAGTVTWQADYQGDAHHPPLGKPVSLTVRPATTDVRLHLPPSPYHSGTLAVSVNVSAPGTTSVSGSVEIRVLPGSARCTVALPATSCQVQLPQPGSYTIEARYPGDGAHAPAQTSQIIAVERSTRIFGGSFEQMD